MTSSAIICYNNLAKSSLLTSVTASSEAAGASHENAYDWLTTTYWSPATYGVQTLTFVYSATVTADYFALYRHNLGAVSGAVKLQYSTDGGTTWLDVFATLTPTDNEIVLKVFTAITADHWRIKFYVGSSSVVMSVGVVAFGPKMTTQYGMPAGFIVPRNGRTTKILNNITDTGQFAGRSIIAHGAKSTIQIKAATQDWVRSAWEPFVRHAEIKPFFFSRNHAAYPQDAVFCWASGDIPDAAIGEDRRIQLQMPVQCLLTGE